MKANACNGCKCLLCSANTVTIWWVRECCRVASVFCPTEVNYSEKTCFKYEFILTAAPFVIKGGCIWLWVKAKAEQIQYSTVGCPELSLAADLWNPFWLRHQSHILELLFLANPASRAGLMNKLILMPHSTDAILDSSLRIPTHAILGNIFVFFMHIFLQCLTKWGNIHILV